MKNLEAIEIQTDWEAPIDPLFQPWIDRANEKLQQFWDRWIEKPIEQYVACDFEFVAKTLQAIRRDDRADGNLFCEWGCGFGIVTGLASLLGWEAIGIEAESFLVQEARKLLKEQKISAEIWEGNFLPEGAEDLADQQSNHASLFHAIRPCYSDHDVDVDDFALIFCYPWPGEHFFLQQVFERFARRNALLVMFRGPYHIEVFRKRN